jgi:hypothetical protein
MIEADPSLPWTPGALVVWRKITDRLERADEWEEIYRPAAFVAATACANYLAACKAFGATADLTRECGALARWALAEMSFPLTEAEPIPRDDLGRDLDLVRVVLEPVT